MSQIETALTKIFDRQRIVFWYDAKREPRAEFDALTLPDVEKIVLGNNQFGVKHRVQRDADSIRTYGKTANVIYSVGETASPAQEGVHERA